MTQALGISFYIVLGNINAFVCLVEKDYDFSVAYGPYYVHVIPFQRPALHL